MWSKRILLGVLLVVTFALVACQARPSPGGTVSVVASVLPLADWARTLGGERVQVELIVPPGVDPRSYTLSRSQRIAITRADLVLLNGLGLEPWADEVLERTRGARPVVIEMSDFVGPLTERVPRRTAIRPPEDSAAPLPRVRPGQERFVPAPIYSRYLWLDVSMAQAQVDVIARGLARVDPDGLAVYRQAAARYHDELQNLDGAIFRTLDRVPRRVIESPDRFLYPFSRRYGLTVVTPNRLRAVRRSPVPPLVVDALIADAVVPQPAPNQPVVTLNFLSGDTYLELMQTNVQSMTLVMAGQQPR